MQDLFGGTAIWFSIPAFVGTTFFLLRTALMLVGGTQDLHHDLGMDVDAGMDVDMDGGGDVDVDHADPGDAFKILSIQAIAAFAMGFGWGGLAVVRGLGMPALFGIPAGAVTGAGMVWILGKLLAWMYRMQASGTLPVAAALHEQATVHIQVPAQRQGKGSIRVVIGDRQRYYHAVTDGEMIDSYTQVRVTEINDDSSVTVERLRTELPPRGV